MAFAGSLRQGKLHRGRPPSATVIKTTLREVARFLDSRGLGDPRCSTPGQPFLDAPLTNMIRRWKGEDPGPKPQQALPSSVVHWIAKVYRTSPILQHRITSELVDFAYFFLLRVGEYTPTTPCRGQHKCTVPLRKGDITFWHQTRVIPMDSPLERLLQADGATINVANQKNGVKDAKVSHTPSGDPTICPCRSLARLVDALSGLPADTALRTFRTATGTSQVTSPGDSGGSSPPRGKVGQPPFSGV
jgi:hypothetical protein